MRGIESVSSIAAAKRKVAIVAAVVELLELNIDASRVWRERFPGWKVQNPMLYLNKSFGVGALMPSSQYRRPFKLERLMALSGLKLWQADDSYIRTDVSLSVSRWVGSAKSLLTPHQYHPARKIESPRTSIVWSEGCSVSSLSMNYRTMVSHG